MYTKFREGQLRTTNIRKGYHQLHYQKANGVPKTAYIHRLVAKAFIPNPLNKPSINHIDWNKLNNHYTNLEWCTDAENVYHAVVNGLYLKGIECVKAKLTDQDIENIYTLAQYGASSKDIADCFPVSQSNICNILAKKTWRHILLKK